MGLHNWTMAIKRNNGKMTKWWYRLFQLHNYRSILSLGVELIVCLQAFKVLLLYQVNYFLLGEVNTVVEVTTPEQVVMVPHLPTLTTTTTSTMLAYE